MNDELKNRIYGGLLGGYFAGNSYERAVISSLIKSILSQPQYRKYKHQMVGYLNDKILYIDGCDPGFIHAVKKFKTKYENDSENVKAIQGSTLVKNSTIDPMLKVLICYVLNKGKDEEFLKFTIKTTHRHPEVIDCAIWLVRWYQSLGTSKWANNNAVTECSQKLKQIVKVLLNRTFEEGETEGGAVFGQMWGFMYGATSLPKNLFVFNEELGEFMVLIDKLLLLNNI